MKGRNYMLKKYSIITFKLYCNLRAVIIFSWLVADFRPITGHFRERAGVYGFIGSAAEEGDGKWGERGE